MIRILALLCLWSDPRACHSVAVTNSDLQEPLTMTACLVGMPALADWMRSFPQYRLAGWKCEIGGGAKGERT